MREVTVSAPTGPVRAVIQLPRSKSVANRALILASLHGDLEAVRDRGDGDDTRVLYQLLREKPRVMHCGAGGTTFRFLLAWAAVQEGSDHLITGIQRLLDRPHHDLVEALRTLGADIESIPEGYLVRGRRMPGGTVHFDSPISSQYLSALLLVAPRMTNGVHLRWTGTRLSEPFVHMTLKVLAHHGVFPVMELDGVRVPPGDVQPAVFDVPPDWSAAAFWYETVALVPGAEILLADLADDTLQGDREARHLWATWVDSTDTPEGLRITHRVDVAPWEAPHRPGNTADLRHVPDLFQPLAITLAARGDAAVLSGLDNLRVKETDRLQAIHDALLGMGRLSHFQDGTFTLGGGEGPLRPTGQAIDPDVDHRMAMSLAPLAAVLGTITIRDPRVVDKSYPAFWDDLRSAGFHVEHHLPA